MQPKKACDHNDNDYYTDDVENVHYFAPIEECPAQKSVLRYPCFNAAGVFQFQTKSDGVTDRLWVMRSVLACGSRLD
jgi:hypothetical protein